MQLQQESPQPSLRCWLSRSIVLTMLWFALTEPDLSATLAGIPVVLCATLISLRTLPEIRLNWWALLPFFGFFLKHSFWGAIDVSRRAFSLKLPLKPEIVTYPLRLPDGFPRVVYMNSISLLPGTLSADTEGDMLLIHSLEVGPKQIKELKQLETLILRLYNVNDKSMPE